MVLVTLKTDILNQICSADQLDLLDAVDGLRSQGIDSYVSLPQIIVCGDQSSGKSSVLEAISGVPFPVKSNLCTRFPTELVLRKMPEIGVKISIVPDVTHSELESRPLSSFQETLDSFNNLPELIEKAKTAMAISAVGKTFSKDLLRIEISGPDRPHLTIVDLPGLIHSETKQQSTSDIELVQDVVRSYMEERRSIILAVISAKNDYANQIVLKLARAADDKGNRTLGIITKPDTLFSGSPSELMFVSLAKNQDVEFRLGWHVLKNLDSDTGKGTLIVRGVKEREFFSTGVWQTLPTASLGIEALRERLSALLLAQIAAELPSLMEEIRGKLEQSKRRLKQLGNPRSTLEEQRLYLLQLSETSQSITKAAVSGSYNDPFFGDAKTEIGYQKRLRAIIQNINTSFADNMVKRGHKYLITDSVVVGGTSEPTKISRSKYLDHIEHMISRTRGRELPGTYNPMVIADLFLEQSQPWPGIIKLYAGDVSQAVQRFVRLLVAHIADDTTSERLLQVVFKPALQDLEDALEKKLAALLVEHRESHPITYNHPFNKAVDKLRITQLETEYTSAIITFFNIPSLSSRHYRETLDFRPLLSALMKHVEPIITHAASSKALDCMQVYYKVASERFIDVASVEAVEATVMAKLHDILRPLNVAFMPADDVTKIAGESEEGRVHRKELTTQLHVLEGGMRTCTHIVSIGRESTNRLPIVKENLEDSKICASLGVSSPPVSSPVHTTGSGEDGFFADPWHLEIRAVQPQEYVSSPLEEETRAATNLSKKKKGKRILRVPSGNY